MVVSNSLFPALYFTSPLPPLKYNTKLPNPPIALPHNILLPRPTHPLPSSPPLSLRLTIFILQIYQNKCKPKGLEEGTLI